MNITWVRRRQTVELPEGPVQGLPLWYFPIAGSMAGLYDMSHALPHTAARYFIWGFIAVNILLAKTVLRLRLRLMKALWRNKRTRLLAFGLLALRMTLRLALGAITAELTGAGHLVLGLVMVVTGTASMYFDQWLILRALERSRQAPEMVKPDPAFAMSR
jgi:hypothetical protein